MISITKKYSKLTFSKYFLEEVILAEERTTEEEKMHIIEGTIKFIIILKFRKHKNKKI